MDTYLLTIGLLFLILILVYFHGKKKNDKIAQHWTKSLLPTVKDSFKRIGIGDATYTKEANNLYKMYATGESPCVLMLAALELRKRQRLLSEIFYRHPERVEFKIFAKTKTAFPLLLAIVHSDSVKEIRKAYPDLDKLTNEYKLEGSKLTVMAEDPDIMNSLVTSEIRNLVLPLTKYLEMLYISDIGITYSNAEALVRLNFAHPKYLFDEELNRSQLTLGLALCRQIYETKVRGSICEAVWAKRKKLS